MNRWNSKNRLTQLIVVVLMFFVSTASLAATSQQIEDARAKGLAWLLQNQNGDGSWGRDNSETIRVTSEALNALLNSGTRGYSYSYGLSYITNAEAKSVDSLARQIGQFQNSGVNFQSHIDKLISWRNYRNSWGAYNNYQTSYPDTSLALRVLINDDDLYATYENDILGSIFCEMLPDQRTGDATIAGSWSYVKSIPDQPNDNAKGYILPTVYNMFRLYALKTLRNEDTQTCEGTSYSIQTAIDNGISWLLSQKNYLTAVLGMMVQVLYTKPHWFIPY